MNTNKQEAIRLLTFLDLAPDDVLPSGATLRQLRDFEKRTELKLPNQIREWLSICNAPCVAEGGVFGVSPTRPFLDIESYLFDHPGWRDNNWLPVAGDGCGNYYIVVLNAEDLDFCPVFFVDHEESYDILSHEIAPDFWSFLLWLFKRDLKMK